MNNLEQAEKFLQNEPWLPTPLLPALTIGSRLGVDLWLKREDCTPVGSFKIRGGLVAMDRLGGDLADTGVYVASAGNYGLAIAYAGGRRGVKVTVVVPQGATPSKVERIRILGGEVIAHGNDFDTAKSYARKLAEKSGAAFWEDGVIEEMAVGAATIGTELLEHSDDWDYVLVPLGNGSLIKGIASVFKERSPQTKVIGLVPSGAPAMAQALKGQAWDEGIGVTTSADGLAVRVPIVSIVEELKALVDDVWLVDDSRLLAAVRSLVELEQVMAEPSASITIAAAVGHKAELANKKVAAIITGAHLRSSLLSEAMSCEGVV